MKAFAVLIVAILPTFPAEAQSADGAATRDAPWGVQIAGNYSQARAMEDYRELQKKFSEILAERPPMIVTGKMAGGGPGSFYQVRVPASNRSEAEELCKELKAAGGACVVVKS
jgi:hypothetical protein